MERYKRKLDRFARFALDLAGLSTCVRARNGAVVVPFDLTAVWAIGYNGPARGLPNDACTGHVGSCGCAHAEANAIVKLNPTQGPCLMICTTSPCLTCANMIVNAGCVRAVLYDTTYRDQRGTQVLYAANIALAPSIEDIPDDLLQQWWKAGRGSV